MKELPIPEYTSAEKDVFLEKVYTGNGNFKVYLNNNDDINTKLAIASKEKGLIDITPGEHDYCTTQLTALGKGILKKGGFTGVGQYRKKQDRNRFVGNAWKAIVFIVSAVFAIIEFKGCK